MRAKRDEHSIIISSVSAPQIRATMLKQAQLRRGLRVMEVGSGGYHAALTAELVDEDGKVTTIDLDVIDRFRMPATMFTATVRRPAPLARSATNHLRIVETTPYSRHAGHP